MTWSRCRSPRSPGAELMCIPGLDDPAVIEERWRARLCVLSDSRRGTLAERYTSS
jgi:hypothetical protein